MYEIRIYDSAAPGTKATLNEAFDSVMRESKNCFAQLDTDVDWIEFDSEMMMFLTSSEIPSTVQLSQPATLHLMCASHKVEVQKAQTKTYFKMIFRCNPSIFRFT